MIRVEGEMARVLIGAMRPYKRVGTTVMVQMHEDFVIGQASSGAIAGEISAPAGSWLAHDPITGAFWPISDQTQMRNYLPVE